MELVAERARLARSAGLVKRAVGRPTVDPAQEAVVFDRAARRAGELGLDPALARAAFAALVALARAAQEVPDTSAPAAGARPGDR